jgi:hypothetical protein
MQDVRINEVDAQMFQRAGERLFDLLADRRLWIVRQAVVLSRKKGKLGLQEDIVAANEAAANRRGNRFTDRGFIIMSPLVRRIDASKALLQGQFGQTARLALFPGGAIQKAGHPHTIDEQGSIDHHAGIIMPDCARYHRRHRSATRHPSFFIDDSPSSAYQRRTGRVAVGVG